MSPTAEASTDAEVAVFLGMTNRILATGEHTDGAVGVVEVTVPPGGGAPPHANSGESLAWYVLDGTLTELRSGNPTAVEAGGLIFLPRGEAHTFMNQSDSPARALMICTPGGFEDFLVDLAAVLPDEAPDGPPPQAAIEAMQEIGTRYGVAFHLE